MGRGRVIYLIRCTGTGLIKIGHSLDPDARLIDLQIGSASVLDLILVTPGGRHEEVALHRHFAGRRVRGEWFALSRGDLGLAGRPSVPSTMGCLRAPRCPGRGDPWTIEITCPFCGRVGGGGGADSGPRVSHCGGGAYSLETVNPSVAPWARLIVSADRAGDAE